MPTVGLKKVIENCRLGNLDLIIGCDAKANHTVWGSTNINNRGEALLEYLSGTQMDVVN